MNIDLDKTEEQEKQKVEAILKTIPLPPEIARTEISVKPDSMGDSAIWVTFWVSKDVKFSVTKAKALNLVAEQAQRALLAGDLVRYPFVTLDQAA